MACDDCASCRTTRRGPALDSLACRILISENCGQPDDVHVSGQIARQITLGEREIQHNETPNIQNPNYVYRSENRIDRFVKHLRLLRHACRGRERSDLMARDRRCRASGISVMEIASITIRDRSGNETRHTP